MSPELIAPLKLLAEAHNALVGVFQALAKPEAAPVVVEVAADVPQPAETPDAPLVLRRRTRADRIPANLADLTDADPARSRSTRTQAIELDARVMSLLATLSGRNLTDLRLAMPDVPRSRLEWSLRRLLGAGKIYRVGNTCRARYSLAQAERSSSLRAVGS